MKTKQAYLGKYASGILLLSAVAMAQAQSTWNFFISDAGGGNSLVTWSVTGSLATPPGPVVVSSMSSIAVSINAPGIYADAYVASGTPTLIPTPDGSHFLLDNISSVYAPIVVYEVNNVSGNGNDSFTLVTSTLFPRGDSFGHEILYSPGTQSVTIPVDYSNFNPGTYQSQESGFNSPLRVNLTVGPVPEPSTLALSAVGLGALLVLRRRNKHGRLGFSHFRI